MNIILFISEIFLFFFIRLLPVWRFRHQGCDAYYFLLTAEIFRKKKKIPIVLPPYYLADIDEQWYPPGFSVFLGLLPEWIVQQYHWLINHILDFLNLLLLDCFIWAFHMGWRALLVANLVYIFTPTLTLEYRGLTSRSLGNLLFTLFMMAMWGTLTDIRWLPAALFVWLLILFTHKMTMQLGIVMGIVLSVVFKTWLPVIVVIGGIPLAIVLSMGYYWKILKGHWDIVSFWHKNLPWLGAHQVKHSPIYGNPQDYINEKKGFIIHVKLVLRGLLHNPFVILLLSFFPLNLAQLNHGFYRVFLIVWITVTVIWFFLTTLIPGIKSFGEGYKYIKYMAWPIACLSVYVPSAYLSVGLVLSLIVIYIGVVRTLKGDIAFKIDPDFEDCIQWIKKHDKINRIGCINSHLADPIAYFCCRQVLWGTHHYYFNEKVIDFFPVLRKSIEELGRKYDLRYWLINTNYTNTNDIGLYEKQCIYKSGSYELFKIV